MPADGCHVGIQAWGFQIWILSEANNTEVCGKCPDFYVTNEFHFQKLADVNAPCFWGNCRLWLPASCFWAAWVIQRWMSLYCKKVAPSLKQYGLFSLPLPSPSQIPGNLSTGAFWVPLKLQRVHCLLYAFLAFIENSLREVPFLHLKCGLGVTHQGSCSDARAQKHTKPHWDHLPCGL